MQYYDALAALIEVRRLLAIPVAEAKDNLQEQLYLNAEALAGKIQFYGAGLKEIQGRLAIDPQNAELQTTSKKFASKHELYIGRLKTIVDLMNRLEMNSASYKAVLLSEGMDFSVRDFEGAVMRDMLRDGVSSLRQSVIDMAPDALFRLFIFLVILFAFRALSRVTRRGVLAACDRSGADISTLLRDVLGSVSSGTVMVVGILMALSQIGISLGPMLAGLGVAGFIVGFALQDTLGNFAAGGMILIYRPYDVDDFVEVTGASGLVKKMSLVSTTITTFDNQTLVVPNSKIWGDVIKNVTAQKVRRVDLEFAIGYGDDIELAERVLAGNLLAYQPIVSR